MAASTVALLLLLSIVTVINGAVEDAATHEALSLGKPLTEADLLRLKMRSMPLMFEDPQAFEINKKPLEENLTPERADALRLLKEKLRFKTMYSFSPLQFGKRGSGEPKRNLLPTIEKSQAVKFRCYFSPIHC